MSIEKYLQNGLSKSKMYVTILGIVFSGSLVDILNAQETIEDKKKEKIEVSKVRLGIYNNDNYIRPYIGDSSDGRYYTRTGNKIGIEVGGLDAGKSFNFDTQVDLKKGDHYYIAHGEIAGYTIYGKEKDLGDVISYQEYLRSLTGNQIAVYDEDERNKLQIDKAKTYTYGSSIGDAQRIDQIDVGIQKMAGSIESRKSTLKMYAGGGFTGYGKYGMEKVQKAWHGINTYPHPEISYTQESGWTPYIQGSVSGTHYVIGQKSNGIQLEGGIQSKIPIYSSKGISETNIEMAVQWIKNKRQVKAGYKRGSREGPKNSFVISNSLIDGMTNSYYYHIEAPLPFTKESASVYYNVEKYTNGGYSARIGAGSKFDNKEQMNIGIKIDMNSKNQ